MGKTITPVRPKKKTTKKNKEDLLESIMWRITKVKRLRFVRKCSSIQSVCLLIKKLGLCCQKVEAPTDNVSHNRGKAEPTHKRTVKLPTQLITTL